MDLILARVARWAVPEHAVQGIGNPTAAAFERLLLTLTWELTPRLGQAFLGLAQAMTSASDAAFAFAQALPEPDEDPEP